MTKIKKTEVPKRAAQPQKFFTFKNTDPRSHLKIGTGQHLAYQDASKHGGVGGYYAAPGVVKAVKTGAGKPSGQIVKTAVTPQDSFSTIETPAQIEARVKRMATESFTTQQKVLNDQADRLRREAEGRRLALQDAYGAAAKLNAGFGLDVQNGWEQAAHTITGLAGTATGGVKDSLLADLASQEQALSRVGAGGTGFDATSQANTEYFRGGGIPGEYDTRMGGIGRQWMNEQAKALAARGLQEGIANENTDRGKINADLASQVDTLTTSRQKYESDLREQLLGARGDQIKAVQDDRQWQAEMAIKKIQIEQAQQKINNQFKVALANATTSADRAEVYRWLAEQNNILETARVGISQQNADSSRISANASATRAANAAKAAKSGGTAATKRQGVKDANTAANTAIEQAIGKYVASMPGIATPKGQVRKDYVQSPEYGKALAAAKALVSKNYFGDLMYQAMSAMGPFLREIGYTPDQIKRAAYLRVQAKVSPPQAWLKLHPGYGPKAKP